MNKDRSLIVVEQRFDCSKEILWQAITNHADMVSWYFENIPVFEPVEGFTTHFKIQTAERTFTHHWKVTEVIPGTKIAYDWTFDEYEGSSTSIFEILEKENTLTLRLSNIGLDKFPEDVPEFRYESCLGGWNYFIKESLANYLGSA